MSSRSVCLGVLPAAAVPLLQAAAARLRQAEPALQQVQLLRVLRHIPTDSINDRQAPAGVAPQADGIGAILALHFRGGAAGGPPWEAFMRHVRSLAPVLLTLDAEPNVPIAPQGAAVQGGLRRWMLLARKAETQPMFRDAWFGRHATLVKALPRVDGYLQHLVTRCLDADGRDLGYEALPVDGIAELCFADEAAMDAAYTSDARLPLRDDGRDLLSRISTLLVQGEVLA